MANHAEKNKEDILDSKNTVNPTYWLVQDLIM